MDGQDWWLLDDIDRYAQTRTAPVPGLQLHAPLPARVRMDRRAGRA
jgi:hypothetical protein